MVATAKHHPCPRPSAPCPCTSQSPHPAAPCCPLIPGSTPSPLGNLAVPGEPAWARDQVQANTTTTPPAPRCPGLAPPRGCGPSPPVRWRCHAPVHQHTPKQVRWWRAGLPVGHRAQGYATMSARIPVGCTREEAAAAWRAGTDQATGIPRPRPCLPARQSPSHTRTALLLFLPHHPTVSLPSSHLFSRYSPGLCVSLPRTCQVGAVLVHKPSLVQPHHLSPKLCCQLRTKDAIDHRITLHAKQLQ